jgi:hypothetical protein
MFLARYELNFYKLHFGGISLFSKLRSLNTYQQNKLENVWKQKHRNLNEQKKYILYMYKL